MEVFGKALSVVPAASDETPTRIRVAHDPRRVSLAGAYVLIKPDLLFLQSISRTSGT